jgi:alpha-1,2-mannosyltransferase
VQDSTAAQVSPRHDSQAKTAAPAGHPGGEGPARAGLGGAWWACAIGALALISLGLGVFELVRAAGPYDILEYDDGVWFGAAVRLADGALPYRDFVLDQPPGVPLLLSPVALLSHAFGTGEALVAARYVTVLVEAANVVLVGWLVRHRSVLCVVVAGAVVAVYPAAVITSRTVMLEPYCDLWCLIGLVAAFDKGHVTTTSRRALMAGAAFGVAGTCKAFALLPFVVLVVQMALRGPAGRRQAGRCVAAAAGVFAFICAPFVLMAPAGFFRQVVLTQLERGAIANPSLWGRVAQLVGVPPAPSMFGVPSAVLDDVVFAVSAVVCLALVVAWWAARRPAGSSLERYGVVVVVLTAAGLTWPAAFYYHYAAFLAPFLALPLGLAAGRLYGANRRALVRGAASALVVVGTVHAVRVVQTTDPPGLVDIAWLDRAVPSGACAITDDPAVLVLADRFSAPPGCSDMVDADGSTLSWSGGRRGYQSLSQPRAITDWLGVLGQTGYVVVTQGMVPARIPWGPALLDYLHAHFHLSAEQAGVVVWARRSS